jgi:hypothetical protein
MKVTESTKSQIFLWMQGKTWKVFSRESTRHYPSHVFSWRPSPSGKVAKTVREGHPWRLPSGISRQEKTDRKSRVSLTESRQGMIPDGSCRQERVSPSVFSSPSGESFPVSYTLTGKVQNFHVSYSTVREGSTFLCPSTTVRETSFLISIKAHLTIQIID